MHRKNQNEQQNFWIEQIAKENQSLQEQVSKLSDALNEAKFKHEQSCRSLSVEKRTWQDAMKRREEELLSQTKKMLARREAQLSEAAQQCSLLRKMCSQLQEEKEALKTELEELKRENFELQNRHQEAKLEAEDAEKMKTDQEFHKEDASLWRRRSYEAHMQLRREKSPGWNGMSKNYHSFQLNMSLSKENHRSASAPPQQRFQRAAPDSPTFSENLQDSFSTMDIFENGPTAAQQRIFQALGGSPNSMSESPVPPPPPMFNELYKKPEHQMNSRTSPPPPPMFNEPYKKPGHQMNSRTSLGGHCLFKDEDSKGQTTLTPFQLSVLNEVASSSSTLPATGDRKGLILISPPDSASPLKSVVRVKEAPPKLQFDPSSISESRSSSTQRGQLLNEPSKLEVSQSSRTSQIKIEFDKDGNIKVNSTR